jgi:hypothetical protein
MEGWIKIHREIREHWIWKDPLYFQAWIAIILNVNHEDKNVLIEKELIECKRGQSLYSLAGWSKLFGNSWTIQKTRTFFGLLKNDKMIIIEGLRKTTRLTVCNYDKYQIKQQTDNKQTTDRQQADNILITTNKNDKECKECKEEEGDEISKAWERWKFYKEKEFKFKYKSLISEEAAKTKLINLSGNNAEIAIKIIEESISNGWQGLFKLKTNGNGFNGKPIGASNEALARIVAEQFGVDSTTR